MDLPDFELSAAELKELAATELAVAPATARVAVGADDFLLRLCANQVGQPRLFFRLDAPRTPVINVTDAKSPSAKKIVELLQGGDRISSSLFDEIHFTQWEFELPDLLWELLAELNWTRVFEVDTTQEVRFRFQVKGLIANWCCIHYKPQNSDALYLAGRASRLIDDEWNSASESDIVKFIDCWMGEEMSDVALAYLLSKLPEAEQIPHLLCFENGDWTRYARLLQYLSWNDYQNWQQRHPNELSVDCGALIVEQEQVDDKYRWIIHGLLTPEGVMPDAMRPALEALDIYFSPTIKPKWNDTDIVRLMRKLKVLSHNLEFPPPTSAHYRLEAKFVLREFFLDKLSPAELADLMGEA